jgi:hypothetical protein
LLYLIEKGVELILLGLRETEPNGGRRLEDFVKFVELRANAAKTGIERIDTIVGKYVVPNQTDIHEIENEATEKAVFGIGNEREDLSRRTGEDGRKSGRLEFDKFAVLASVV